MSPLQLLQGDCLEVLHTLPDNSVDSIVTDPPYGLSFMGKKWDYDVPSVEVWTECLRVLKPGGHLLAFAGTRTQHRMAVRIEDAGFEIRDMIAWVYGSGFPKSLDVSKAIDKAAGAKREILSERPASGIGQNGAAYGGHAEGATQKIDAGQWSGWGTALKPALEPITVARKPLVDTVAENVLEHGTGAINVDGCRVQTDDGANRARPPRTPNAILGGGKGANITASEHNDAGRWPANLIHDGSDEVVGLFPESTSGAMKAGTQRAAQDAPGGVCYGTYGGNATSVEIAATKGSAARFFYCAKASKRDRDDGLEGFALGNNMRVNGPRESEEAKRATLRCNTHPTVKPTDLMAYLCRLVTPPGGVVLDPFMGSGSTGKAAMREGFRFIGIEREPDYMRIAEARIEHELIKDLV